MLNCLIKQVCVIMLIYLFQKADILISEQFTVKGRTADVLQPPCTVHVSLNPAVHFITL